MKAALDKLGGVGAVVAAAACPVCFPKLALIGALFGLGGFAAYEAQIVIAAQLLVLLALIGHALAYRQHRNRWLLGVALASALAFFVGLYAFEPLAYAGFAGLLIASSADLWRRILRRRRKPVLEAEITCAKCGFRKTETMPTDSCQFFYECSACGALLRAKAGDCCVYCSYGSVKCPPMQVAAR